MNLTAGVGVLVGSAAGGEIAHLAGDLSAYGFAAAACLATLTALTIYRQGAVRPATVSRDWPVDHSYGKVE